MNQFPSIRKIDQAILYGLEQASSLSVLLLAFGLIASMANVLTKGSVLSDNIIMQRIWAWTQCIAIDASVAGTIIRTYQLFEKRSWAKFTLYALLSSLLLFTAAIVSNIESVQQTLEERNKVIAAYTAGIQRREICAHRHWESARYTSIVKPALDAYEEIKARQASTNFTSTRKAGQSHTALLFYIDT